MRGIGGLKFFEFLLEIFFSKMFLCRENNYAVNFKKCKVSPINLLNFYIYLIKNALYF